MTINNQQIEITYDWDGVPAELPIPFEIYDPIQVKWEVVDNGGAPSNVIAMVAKDADGNWVLDVTGGSAAEIKVWRETPITQEVDYNPYDAFPAETHEGALDKLTMICQELYEDKVTTEEGDERYLKLSGGSMTGDIQMTGSRVRTLADPLEDQDAVNKRWYKANQIPGIQGEVGPIGPPPVVTADAESVPNEEGADVTVTPDSDPYTGVHMDFKIPAGPVGVTPDFSADVETLGPEEEATVTVTQTGPPDAHAVNLSFAIPQGERGLKGEGIDFKGNLPSASDLPTTGEADGDAYFIEDEQVLYVWGGGTQKWENLGDVRGPQGDAGNGWKSGVYNAADGKVTFTGQDWSPELTFTTDSLIGEQGPPGDDAYNPTVGNVTTSTKPDGTDAEASVTANGDGNFDFDFKIPRGHSPAVNSVTTTTGAPSTDAVVEVTSTPDFDLDFAFTVPEGIQGIQGIPGISHYDYGTIVDSTVTGFPTLATKPTSTLNGSRYEVQMSASKTVGAIQLKTTSISTPFFILRLDEFDLGHTLVVVVDATSGIETGLSLDITGAPNVLAPKGEIPNTSAGEIALYALTRTELGVFINVTSGFETV